MGWFEEMKKRGWIDPEKYNYEEVMQVIDFATKPVSLAVFNIALFQYLVTQPNSKGASYFLISAFLYLYIAFIISMNTEYARKDKTDVIESEIADLAFKIVIYFIISMGFTAIGLVSLAGNFAGLIAG